MAFQQNRSPGEALSNDDLLSLGWPGEKLQPSAGTNRVRNALTQLRRLGLRDILLRNESGYLIDPQVPLSFQPPRQPPCLPATHD